MTSTHNNKDKEVVELMRVMQKGVSKYGVRKVTDKIKEIDIEDSYANYTDVRDFIIESVCILMNVKKEQIINKGKRGHVTTARKIVIVVIKTHFDISDEELGRYFSGRTRQVIYKIMKEYERMDRDNKLDQNHFYKHFDIIDTQTREYLELDDK